MPKYHILDRKVIFDHPKVRIVTDKIEHQGNSKDYLYLTSPVDAVATVGFTDNNKVIMTRQYRHPIGKTILDLPAGRLNPGELPIDGARREFEEETGFSPNHIEKIGYYNQFPGTIRAATNLFFASDLEATQQNLDEGEILEIVLISPNALLNMILNGEMVDGSIQIGLLLAIQKGLISIH